MFETWSKICKSHYAACKIINGQFFVGIEWSKNNGSEIGTDWELIQSTDELMIALGY